jgi:hypothetical protein
MNTPRRFAVALAVIVFAAIPIDLRAQDQKTSADLQRDREYAVGSLRSINTAEAYYQKQYKIGWSPTLGSLGVPHEGTKPSASAAGVLDNSLTSGKKNNYVFIYKAGKPDASGRISTYAVTASPAKWREAIIRGTTENRPARASDPPLQ